MAFFDSLSVEQIAELLEDASDVVKATVFIEPPENALLSDGDSDDDEPTGDINKLSGNQLRAGAELVCEKETEDGLEIKRYGAYEEDTDEDEVPGTPESSPNRMRTSFLNWRRKVNTKSSSEKNEIGCILQNKYGNEGINQQNNDVDEGLEDQDGEGVDQRIRKVDNTSENQSLGEEKNVNEKNYKGTVGLETNVVMKNMAANISDGQEINSKSSTLKERLGKLEDELDQLISLQETIKQQSQLNSEAPLEGKQSRNTGIQRCPCKRVTCTVMRDHRNERSCSLDSPLPLPLATITRCLQHINLNISKGTQAITKIANSSIQKSDYENKILYHEACAKKSENLSAFSAVLKTSTVNKITEDALFKELREEKDKRQRAENQVKVLKEESKKTQSELQEKVGSVLQLQKELRETLAKLEETRTIFEKQNQEHQRSEYYWPIKFDHISKELEEEQVKRKEAEIKLQKMHDILQTMYVDVEEQLSVKKTVDWLKDQNRKLICLTDKLQKEIDGKNTDVARKDEMIEENLKRIKQLACVCERLRDQLIVSRDKVVTVEEKLKMSAIRCQKLTDKFLETQSALEDLKKSEVQNKQETTRLSELLRNITTKNASLHARVEELSEVIKRQNALITSQSEALTDKEEQLKLAYSNIKLQSQRLEDLEKKNISEFENSEAKHLMESDINKLRVKLNNEKENLLIKEKIIESHLQTITQLKKTITGKEEELNWQKREGLETERKLAIEQTTNEELRSKLKYLQNRKEELKQKVEELENGTEERLSLEHARRLEQIEKQVRDKQKEWESQKLQLVQEKEEALESLRCSAQRTVKSTADHQEEVAMLKSHIDSLSTKLGEKDKQLQEETKKILDLTEELHECRECADRTKQKFEENLKKACEVWQKTLQHLQM